MDLDWTQYRNELLEFLPRINVDTPALNREIKSLFGYFFLFLFNQTHSPATLLEFLTDKFKQRGLICDVQSEQMKLVPINKNENCYATNIYVEPTPGKVKIIYLDYTFNINSQLWGQLCHLFKNNRQQIVELFIRYDLIEWELGYAIPKRCIKYLIKHLNIEVDAYASPLDYTLPIYYSLFTEDQVAGAKYGSWVNDKHTSFLLHPPWNNVFIQFVVEKIKQRLALNCPSTIVLIFPQECTPSNLPELNFNSSCILPANTYELFRPSRNKLMRINKDLFIGVISTIPDLKFNCEILKQILKYIPREKYIPQNRQFMHNPVSSKMRVGDIINYSTTK